MYAPIATSLLLFMLLLNSTMNRRNSTSKNVLCENYEFNSDLNKNFTDEKLKNIKKEWCNCNNSNSQNFKKSWRKEIRELSFEEYSQMVNALWLSADKLIFPTNNLIQECGIANFLDSLLIKHFNLSMLMPYWNYKLDLTLNKPANSRIFNLISTYNKNNHLNTDFSSLAQIIVEQILLQRDQSIDDKIYILLDNEKQWLEYKQAYELTDVLDSEVNRKILKLFLLISIDIGIGYETDYRNYQLQENNCIKANKWLYWNITKQKCQAKENIEELNYLKFNNYTDNEMLIPYTNKVYIEKNLFQQSNYNENKLETIQMESSGETINEEPIFTNKETNLLWPSFNIKMKNSKEKFKKKDIFQKHRKHNKKKNNKSLLTISKEANKVPLTKITQIPYDFNLKSHQQKTFKKKIEDYIRPFKPSKKTKNKSRKKEIDTLKTYDSTTLMEGVNDLDLLLPYLKKRKLPKGTIQWKSNKTPFPVVYFTITIIEGPLAKRQRRPPSNRRRTNDARIFLMGLNMPTGYTQITEGSQIKSENRALVRTLNPQTTGPFVEFKIRVENKYGASCKQFCLDSNKQYKRCSRRIIRLSTYKKFSDPITFYTTPNDAMEAQWTGRGYYRRRKFDYLLFRCD